MLFPYTGESSGQEMENDMDIGEISGFKELNSNYYIGEIMYIYIYYYVHIVKYMHIYIYTHCGN